MPLTDRERQILNTIQDWESNLLNYEPNDFQLAYQKYIERSFAMLPEPIQTKFFTVIDNWLFHLHAMIQGSQLQIDATERILTAGRIFNHDLEKIADLKTLDIDQLNYIAEQQIARHRFYSFAQGGLAGSGGTIFLGMDIPAMAVINLRAVQLIAMTYGFEVNTPYEMMTSLKIFHASLLPPRIQKNGWKTLMKELEETVDYYFYEGNEQVTDVTSLELPIRHLLKAMVITLFRKKIIQGIPLVSIAIGAAANYRLTRKVTEFAHKYYQFRYLKEKEARIDEYRGTQETFS